MHKLPSMFFAIIIFAATAATATENCQVPARGKDAMLVGGLGNSLFVNPCGDRYETGYRLEGSTLFFPGGGRHAIGDASPDIAEALLREAYGLIGPREDLIRTRW